MYFFYTGDFFDGLGAEEISERKADAILTQDEEKEDQEWGLVFFNDCFGGGKPSLETFSDAAREAYNSFRAQNHGVERSAFLAILKVGREESCTRGCEKFGIALVKNKYIRWVGKHEYDGYEALGFKLAEFVVDTVRGVLEKNGTISLQELKAIEEEGKAVVINVVYDPDY
jgi:hypothetical protein